MEINKSANWRLDDPDPGRRLDEIAPVRLRARALLARNSNHPAVRDDFVRVLGVIDMFGALDYHSGNLAALEANLSPYLKGIRDGVARQKTDAEASAIEHGRYEAIAYLATLGRFYYFARAIGSLVDTPTIDRLLVFRHKVAAHRSIDMQKGESPDLQTLHAAERKRSIHNLETD